MDWKLRWSQNSHYPQFQVPVPLNITRCLDALCKFSVDLWGRFMGTSGESWLAGFRSFLLIGCVTPAGPLKVTMIWVINEQRRSALTGFFIVASALSLRHLNLQIVWHCSESTQQHTTHLSMHQPHNPWSQGCPQLDRWACHMCECSQSCCVTG